MLLARAHFVWEFDENQPAATILQVLQGATAGNFMLLVNNLQHCSLTVLSTLSQLMFQLRKALAHGKSQFALTPDSLVLTASPNFGVALSYTVLQDIAFTQGGHGNRYENNNN